MKGTFFVKPLEYNIETQGESWTQGSTLKGQISVTSHTGDTGDISNQGCHLCYSSNKKIKAKDSSGLKLVESKLFAKESNTLDFEFTLPNDCQISDSIGGLYLVCGNIDSPFEVGTLQLKVTPIETISRFIEVFEQFYRFKLKPFKNKKGAIEAAVTPPDSNEWRSIQKMSLNVKMKDSDLITDFNFTLKRISLGATTGVTADEKKQIQKVLTKKDYELYGATNQEGIKAVISDVLSLVKLKSV